MKEWTAEYQCPHVYESADLIQEPRIHILKIDAEGQDLNVRTLRLYICLSVYLSWG